MDMSQYSKKEFPSQTENRKQWILDTVRANQLAFVNILGGLLGDEQQWSQKTFNSLHKQDRDALLVPGGVFTGPQIKVLSDGLGDSNN